MVHAGWFKSFWYITYIMKHEDYSETETNIYFFSKYRIKIGFNFDIEHIHTVGSGTLYLYDNRGLLY